MRNIIKPIHHNRLAFCTRCRKQIKDYYIKKYQWKGRDNIRCLSCGLSLYIVTKDDVLKAKEKYEPIEKEEFYDIIIDEKGEASIEKIEKTFLIEKKGILILKGHSKSTLKKSFCVYCNDELKNDELYLYYSHYGKYCISCCYILKFVSQEMINEAYRKYEEMGVVFGESYRLVIT